jgi:hypothetical protein
MVEKMFEEFSLLLRSLRIPPTPLRKGGFEVPLSKGDLGGFRSENEAK